jgi:hypothetical protein
MIATGFPEDLPWDGRNYHIDITVIRNLMYQLGLTRKDMLKYINERRRKQGKTGPDASTLNKVLSRGKVSREMYYEIQHCLRFHIQELTNHNF